MSVLIAINGAPSEKVLESALKQNCDIVIVSDKKITVPDNVKLLIIGDSNTFLKSSIQFANNYSFVYLMEPNTVLLDDCIKKLTQIEKCYTYVYSDYSLLRNINNKCYTSALYLTSLIDKKINTGPNKLIRISKNLPSTLDEILYSGAFLAKHIAEPTYFIEK